METIIAWLAEYGCELTPEALPARHRRRDDNRRRQELERAMRLLRGHGYEVSTPAIAEGKRRQA
jgi:hypothetical protein